MVAEPDPHGRKEANEAFWDGAALRWRNLDLPGADAVQGLIQQLACPPGSLILDAGCGPGRWSISLARGGYLVRGVDLSPRMVAEAVEAASQQGLNREAIDFQVGDMEHIPHPDATFDAVICFNALDFVPSPGAALAELWRVLKPDGRLALMTLGAYSPVKRQSWRRFLPDAEVPDIANHILPWETEALLVEMGWEIVSQKPHFGPAASGVTNDYDEEVSAALSDRVLQQTIASSYRFVALKPGSMVG